MRSEQLSARATGRAVPLADAALVGQWSGQGMTPAGSDPGASIRMVPGGRPQASSQRDPRRLDRPPGVPRPARGGVQMSTSPEYAPWPLHDGRHSVITNRPAVTPGPVRMQPWAATPRPIFRQVPPTDAANVPDVC